ncbi:MAG: hypothetical protein WC714_29125 [Candidatus Obscuribacterales bacterium]|jgi:hypothetical protein
MLTRNLKYNSSGTVDMEIEHPTYGWIPFTASPDDTEPLGRELHSAAIAGTLGAIAAADPLPALTAQDFTAAVQAHLDATARTRNYDGILSACSYATSTNLPFSVEGQACVAWRDAVWLYCYQQLALVQSGARAVPESTAAFIAELPAISW